MLFVLTELLDIVLMTLIIGYLFRDAFRVPRKEHDILDSYRKKGMWHANWHDFWWACALIAPSIVLHELSHKFTALGFGLEATFHAACSTAGNLMSAFCFIQAVAVVMKYLGYGFLIFVPGFVSITGDASPLVHALISFAGPAVHLVLWLGAAILLRDSKKIRRWPDRKKAFVYFTKQINMFLFILNMIPIPGFDGFWVFMNLYKAIF